MVAVKNHGGADHEDYKDSATDNGVQEHDEEDAVEDAGLECSHAEQHKQREFSGVNGRMVCGFAQ